MVQGLFPAQEAGNMARAKHLEKGAPGFGQRHKSEAKPVDLEVIDQSPVQDNFQILA